MLKGGAQGNKQSLNALVRSLDYIRTAVRLR